MPISIQFLRGVMDFGWTYDLLVWSCKLPCDRKTQLEIEGDSWFTWWFNYVPQLSALSRPFLGWEGSPTKIDYRKKMLLLF